MEEARSELEQLRTTILGEIKPLVEQAGFTSEQKYNLLLASAKISGDIEEYKAAHDAARAIEDVSLRADALLELLEEVDVRLGEVVFTSADTDDIAEDNQ